jgi:hypothetical protein
MASVAVLSCCMETEKGRFRVRNQPLTWVELRGFEPLTPSMRTKRAVSRTGQVTVFAQFSDLRKDTITASEAV